MADSYFHTCPYCGTALSIAHLPVEKKVGRCPHCKKPIIVDNFGKESRKPNIYICPKCNQEHIYDGRPPVLRCEKCGNTYLTSTHGVGMIELGVLSRGDNGELPYNKKRDNYTYVINKWLSLSKKVRGGIIAIVVACVATIAGAYILSLPPAIDTALVAATIEPYPIAVARLPFNCKSAPIPTVCDVAPVTFEFAPTITVLLKLFPLLVALGPMSTEL